MSVIETAIGVTPINPARLQRHDDHSGSIEIGKYTDRVVLEDTILNHPVDDVAPIDVIAPLLQGNVAYDAEGLFEG